MNPSVGFDLVKLLTTVQPGNLAADCCSNSPGFWVNDSGTVAWITFEMEGLPFAGTQAANRNTKDSNVNRQFLGCISIFFIKDL